MNTKARKTGTETRTRSAAKTAASRSAGARAVENRENRAAPRRIVLALFAAAFLFAGFSLLLAREAQLTIQPQQAHVGDPVTVTLSVPDVDPGKIIWPHVGEKLGDFTVLSSDTLDPKAAAKVGKAEITWTVAAYDTGSFSTGDLEVVVGDSTLKLTGGKVVITSVLSDSTAAEMRPYKAQVELRYTFRDFIRQAWPWALAALVIVLLFLLIRRWIRKRRQPETFGRREKPRVPPYDEAMAALRALKRDNPLARGDLKGYVSALSEIVKRLLERVHDAPVLEMTTYDVQRWLAGNTIRASREEFLRLLRDADMVKFAKGAVGPERCEEMYRIAERIVSAYKPQPVVNGKEAGKLHVGTPPDGKEPITPAPTQVEKTTVSETGSSAGKREGGGA